MDPRAHSDPDKPLAGIRVLDLSRLLPGPYCSLLLADLGAEVIKVETPLAGDYARMAPDELGFAGIFESLNRGKRSIAVDYRRPAGRDLILKLVETADVFLESSRPGRLDRRGLGAVAVRAVNPSIVYCSLSGFGQSGPYRDRPAHDIDYLALSGVLALMAPAGGPPVPPGLQLADVSAGMLAAVRILAALVASERTGRGSYLDVAVLDAAVSWLGTLGSGLDRAGAEAGPMNGAYPCYCTYQAGDGRWLAVGALELPFWAAFCRGMERDDLLSRQFDPDAKKVVAAIIARRSSVDWLGRFDDDACVAPVRMPREARDDAHIRTRSVSRPESTPAPRLGADTDDVLAEAGFAPAAMRRMIGSGVVSGQQSAERAARATRLGSLLARMAQRDKATAA